MQKYETLRKAQMELRDFTSYEKMKNYEKIDQIS